MSAETKQEKQYDFWFEWRARGRITALNEEAARARLEEFYPDANDDGAAMLLDVVEIGGQPDDLSAPVPAVDATHA